MHVSGAKSLDVTAYLSRNIVLSLAPGLQWVVLPYQNVTGRNSAAMDA